MSNKQFRDELDPIIEQNLNELIKETKEYNYAISKAKDKSKAQMWVALALINHKLNQINLTNTKYKKKIPKKEMDQILKTLETL